MTLRSSIQIQRKDEHVRLRQVYSSCIGGFLFPESYPSCLHEWIQLDSGFCVCRDCGQMHICCRGQCPDVVSDKGERVCSITGCVTSEYEMRPERNALERVGQMAHQAPKHGGSKNPQHPSFLSFVPPVGSTGLWESVQTVVRELLMSEKTRTCALQERERCEGKEQSTFCRIVRDMAQNRQLNCMRPNMLTIVAMVSYGCRKHRQTMVLGDDQTLKQVQEKCTESITCLIMQHGWTRVWRLLQNQTRGREFICSMLYLMRMGITFQKRQVLPKMEILNSLLPMQALLPTVFKIRAKSITEGENIIKLDIRRIPL